MPAAGKMTWDEFKRMRRGRMARQGGRYVDFIEGLEEGEAQHFEYPKEKDGAVESVRSSLYGAAKRQGMKVVTATDADGNLWVALPPAE